MGKDEGDAEAHKTDELRHHFFTSSLLSLF